MLNRDIVRQSNPANYVSWTGYLLQYGGFILSFLLIALGYLLNIQVLMAGGFVILLGAIFLFFAARLTTDRLYEADQVRIIEKLFSMSQAQPEDKIAVIDLGLRRPGMTLGHYLTTGQVFVIDVFNPQLTSGKDLSNARRKAPAFQSDPRLHKLDGQINLLPLPDNNVSAVFLPLILSEFSQQGDRETLLKEVYRILKPNGRLLCAEQKNSWLNWISVGPATSRLQPWPYWQDILSTAGFDILRHEEIHGLTICIRADKPSPYAGKQLSLQLRF